MISMCDAQPHALTDRALVEDTKYNILGVSFLRRDTEPTHLRIRFKRSTQQ